VATSQSAPIDSGWVPESCKSLGYIVGRGGGSFGGGWIANEDLIEYAMNDLRNQASKLGANFVQHDTPTMGQSGSDNGTATTTATISGTAYLCERKMDSPSAPSGTASTPASAVSPAATPPVASTPTATSTPPAASTPTATSTPPAASAACTPGATQACVGPAGCTGGQFCTDDGARYSPCDCGAASK
jgi:hypothetical protein